MPNSPPLTPASSPSALVRSIEWQQTFAWLGRGWCDLTRSGWVSLLHGALMALGGALMLWLARDHFWFLAGAFSGFLLVAPILATSLYALSCALERGESPGLAIVLRTWLNWQN
ncbi:MAG: DUF2189 domain-containing protein, partial [Rhodoferax sp.]|nr:DUF2189 domain-containing protein [Rhodoferax sp.]